VPAGNTTTGSLADSQELIIDSARIVREHDGVFMRVVDMVKLAENTGLSWEEISLSQMEAQAVTEATVLDNPQQYVDTLFTITPTVIGIQTIVTDRTYRRLSKKTIGKMGALAQNAIQRKKDEDFITVLDSATTSLAAANASLTSGHISAAVNRIKGNTTEPSNGTIFTVLHPFQLKDIQDELVAGVGTYAIPSGMTEETFRKGFMGTLFGSNVFEDGNITIDASADAKGGVFAREAIVMVQGHSNRKETRRRPEIGGGADEMFIYDEYAYGERSAGNWLYEIYSDATAPTS
jgi:hypothetical protein